MHGNSHPFILDLGDSASRTYPGPPDLPQDLPEPPVLECLLLAVAHHWFLREPVDRQIELLEGFFRQDEMKAALKMLEETIGLPKQKQDGRSHEDGNPSLSRGHRCCIEDTGGCC